MPLHGQDKKICHFAFSFVFFAAKRLGNKAASRLKLKQYG